MSLFQRGHSPACGHLAPGNPSGGQATASGSRSRPPLARGSFRTCHSQACSWPVWPRLPLCRRWGPSSDLLRPQSKDVHSVLPCLVTFLRVQWPLLPGRPRTGSWGSFRAPSLVLLSCPPLCVPLCDSVCSLCCLCCCGVLPPTSGARSRWPARLLSKSWLVRLQRGWFWMAQFYRKSELGSGPEKPVS